MEDTLQQLALISSGGYNKALEYAATYYAYRSQITAAKGIMFLIVDSIPYHAHHRDKMNGKETIPKSNLESDVGITPETDLKITDVFARLKEKYVVYVICSTIYSDSAAWKGYYDDFVDYFHGVLGSRDNIIFLREPKACVDVMLGIVSISNGTRTWTTYERDMVARGQDPHRISVVRYAFEGSWQFGRNAMEQRPAEIWTGQPSVLAASTLPEAYQVAASNATKSSGELISKAEQAKKAASQNPSDEKLAMEAELLAAKAELAAMKAAMDKDLERVASS